MLAYNTDYPETGFGGTVYNPAGRILLNACDGLLEAENNLVAENPKLCIALQRGALAKGCFFDTHRVNSFHFDTPALSLFQAAGKGVRARPKNAVRAIGVDGELYTIEDFEGEAALKYVDTKYQALAHDHIRAHYTPEQFEEFKRHGILQVLRGENQIAFPWPDDAENLPWAALHTPGKGHAHSIHDVIRELVHPTEHGVLHGINEVDRTRTNFYVAPGQEFDFDRIWPSPFPTDAMRETQKYLRIEVALDHMGISAPQKGRSVAELITRPNPGFGAPRPMPGTEAHGEAPYHRMGNQGGGQRHTPY